MNVAGNDPKIGKTAIFAMIAILTLAVVAIAVQAGFRYFHPDREPAVAAGELRDLRAREEKRLTSYRYIDRAKGTVVLPIDRAMELLVQEAAADKLPYSNKASEVQPEAGVLAGK